MNCVEHKRTTEMFLNPMKKEKCIWYICPYSSILSIRDPTLRNSNERTIKIQIIVNTRRPGNQFNIFTSLLTLTFPSLSYCLLFRCLFRQLTSRKKQGGELPGENVRDKKLRGVFDRLDISNRRKIIIYDHCAATKKFRVDVYVCVYKYCRSWMIQKEIANRIERRFFFFSSSSSSPSSFYKRDVGSKKQGIEGSEKLCVY